MTCYCSCTLGLPAQVCRLNASASVLVKKVEFHQSHIQPFELNRFNQFISNTNAVLLLAHSLRRWISIEKSLGVKLVEICI